MHNAQNTRSDGHGHYGPLGRKYPSPSMVRAKDYARLEAEVRSALVVREVKARLKADAIRNREARKMWAMAKGLA
jgi:hypothetical protein